MRNELSSRELLEIERMAKSKIRDYPFWHEHRYCIPKNAEGKYAVFKSRDCAPSFVIEDQIPLYKWLGINAYTVPIDEDYDGPFLDDAEVFEDEEKYRGVNDQGTALITIEVPCDRIRATKPIPLPTIICELGDIAHCIFRLRNFLPKNVRRKAKWFYQYVVRELESKLEGRYIENGIILNPFSIDVRVSECNVNRYTFEELKKIKSLEYAKLREKMRREGKERQAASGRRSAMKRQLASLEKITGAISSYKLLNDDLPTQTAISTMTGLSRRTVGRNWFHPLIQEKLISPF